jgi:hypothetical protein
MNVNGVSMSPLRHDIESTGYSITLVTVASRTVCVPLEAANAHDPPSFTLQGPTNLTLSPIGGIHGGS